MDNDANLTIFGSWKTMNAYPEMDEFKLSWLKSRGIGHKNDIVDCDPDTARVHTADGKWHQLCEVYTRVMGYHRPTYSMNVGKRSEHKERVFFRERH